MSNKAPILSPNPADWIQVFRGITNATNERTCLLAGVPWSGVGNSAPVMSYAHGRAVAAALLMGNMNSIPLDWAARMSVGGVNMNFFIVKQLPVLPPETYLQEIAPATITYAEAVAMRVLELTYTSNDMVGFARDLGYDGPPFTWDDRARHRLKCELDAIYVHMYGLERRLWTLPKSVWRSWTILDNNGQFWTILDNNGRFVGNDSEYE